MRSPSPSDVSSSLDRSVARRRLTPAADITTRTFSSAVSEGSRLNAWKTIPTSSRRYLVIALPATPSTSTPPSRIEPEAGVSMAPRHDRTLVLPHPEGPSSSVIEPGAALKLSPLIGRTA